MGLRDKAKEKLAEMSREGAPQSVPFQESGVPAADASQQSITQSPPAPQPSSGVDIDKQRLIIVKIKQELEAKRKEILEKEEEIKAKESELSKKIQEIEGKDRELHELNMKIEEQRRNLEKELAGRKQELTERENKVLEMERELAEKLKKYEEKERAISKLEETLRARMLEIAKLEEKTNAAIGTIVAELSELGITRDAFEGMMNGAESETKKLLIVLDELLGELPDEVIDKFAKSPEYKLYEKVLRMYGI